MDNFEKNLVFSLELEPPYYNLESLRQGVWKKIRETVDIFEFYRGLLGKKEDIVVINFIRLLAKQNAPQGHEPCPCGSNKKLRNCHKELVLENRERLQWQLVRKDLDKLVPP